MSLLFECFLCFFNFNNNVAHFCSFFVLFVCYDFITSNRQEEQSVKNTKKIQQHMQVQVNVVIFHEMQLFC